MDQPITASAPVKAEAPVDPIAPPRSDDSRHPQSHVSSVSVASPHRVRIRTLGALIVGGAIMGLLAAIELVSLARRLGLRPRIRVYESGAFGGGSHDHTSAPRCQLWLHRQGTIYAQTQPAVCRELQRSTARLRELAPDAFHDPLALAVEAEPGPVPAAEAFRILGVWHEPVARETVHRWLPGVRLPDGCQVYRVQDGTIDLKLLGYTLALEARRLGIDLVHQGVHSIGLRGDRVRSLVLDEGGWVDVAPDEVVVLTCGARIRPLLAGAGLAVPGLRHFRSHLVANTCGIPALLALLPGGVNCVPHYQADGHIVNIFGNSGRDELPPESDGEPLRSDPRAIDRIIHDVEEAFGLRIPADPLTWPAVKTEIVLDGVRSQAHHARRVAGITNLWVAIPSKMSQSAACAKDLAIRILRESLPGDIARPIWEAALPECRPASRDGQTASSIGDRDRTAPAPVVPDGRPRFSTRVVDGILVVDVTAEVLIEESPIRELSTQLHRWVDEGYTRLLLDLGKTESMAAAVLGTLARLHQRLERGRGRLALCGLNPTLRKMLQICRLDQALKIYADLGEALSDGFAACDRL
jgi:anti-anti-sigma factor